MNKKKYKKIFYKIVFLVNMFVAYAYALMHIYYDTLALSLIHIFILWVMIRREERGEW